MNEKENTLSEGHRMIEIGSLPEEWWAVQLGELVTTQKGRKPKQLLKAASRNALPYLTADYFRTRIPSAFVSKERCQESADL